MSSTSQTSAHGEAKVPAGQTPRSIHESVSSAETPSEFGARLRKYREERGLSLSALADLTGRSKGYLSSLENNHEPRSPSAEVLYSLAKALGVTMSDLMGRRLLPAASSEVPDSLADFAQQAGLNEADVAMLASIQFRGEQPRSAERWNYIYQSIRNSIQMDPPRS